MHLRLRLRDLTLLGGFTLNSFPLVDVFLFDTKKCVLYLLDVYTLMGVQNFHLVNALSYEEEITINVPLFKKLRDIFFFGGTITL